jgi:pimeloyl-ACP methyl ester carboxylesterase
MSVNLFWSIDMLRALRAMALGFIAISASSLTLNVRPAFAQSPAFARTPTNEILASFVSPYAGYYAPYAIQAAAAYLPVKEFDKRRAPPVQEGIVPAVQEEPAAKEEDVIYAVQSIFQVSDFGSSTQEIQSLAQQTLGPWQYQFGSDTYLSCYDPADSDCKKALPAHWWVRRPPVGPAFQVWARTHSFLDFLDGPGSCTEVSIAFRGTFHRSDWLSNFHRFTKYNVDDSYRQLRRNIDAIIRRITTLDCYKRASSAPLIVSVGHSLGGGLAQLAALANKPTGPRIEKVFAFDPSPETGADLVDRKTLDANRMGLTIDRIRQIGEPLSFTGIAQGFPPSNNACDPLVRTVRVDAFMGTTLQLHGMAPLAAQFMELKVQAMRTEAPPKIEDCKTRYEKRTQPGGGEATPIAGLGVLQALFAPPHTQMADLGAQRALYAPPNMQLAILGARRARHDAPPNAQVADLGVPQALLAPLRSKVAELGARRALFAPASLPHTR